MNASRPEGSQATDAVRAAVAADRAAASALRGQPSARNSVVEAAAAFRADLAAAAERRQQFNGSGMRSVGPDIELNPDRGAAVAASAAGAAMVNPDAGFMESQPYLSVAGPPYPAYEEDEEKDEEKAEGVQSEVKSVGGFGRIRKAMSDALGSMSPGRRPTARVVPVTDANSIRHRRDVALAFASGDRAQSQDPGDEDIPMAVEPSARDQHAGYKSKLYRETFERMQGVNPFNLKKDELKTVARALGLSIPHGMLKIEIASRVLEITGSKYH